jgi:zinc finger protein
MRAFASRTADPEITAQNMDFSKPIDDDSNTKDSATKEILKFESFCSACQAQGECRMCVATIPFFKEIIIMAYSCDYCGHKSTEIKQGGGMSDHASKIEFKVQKPEDISRDVFKSDSCVLTIPEVDFSMMPGTLGSMYSTVEGLLDQTIRHLKESNPFGKGDSKDNNDFMNFLGKLEMLKEGNTQFTLVLDDPLSNCFIYNPMAPEDDPQITVEVYERTKDQEDELGITDMVV